MKIKRFFAGLLAAGLTFSLLFHIPVKAAEETAASASGITTNSISGWPQGPDITSTAAVVMEDTTNTIVYAKNMDQTLFPGGTVKVMTTLLALENSQLTDQVTMTATGVSGVTDGGANISAQLDEVFTMEQCLYAMMLSSANDIALQVAEHIGGSVDAFVQMMNTRASELGCTNTVFTNPTGLPDENQHTTAHDMALIMKAAIDNDTFCTIAGTTSYTIPATNVAGGERVLTNNFSMTNSANAAYYQYCLGGREGYTEASGSTLVCGARKDDITLIAVVLQGASGTTGTEAGSLLNYGFDNFQMLSLGDTDFNMLSGGNVYVPAGTSADALTTEDSQGENGQTNRQYYFGGTPVGTAVMAAVQEQDKSLAEQSQQNLAAAQNYSVSHTNLPYYITSPILMKLLEARLPLRAVTVMVQKEAAERLTAEVGSRQAGAVTVAVRYFSVPERLFSVPRGCFLPPPNVDSAVIRLTLRHDAAQPGFDERLFFRLVRAGFEQRRKTLCNALGSAGIPKEAVCRALGHLDLPSTVRAEALRMEFWQALAAELAEFSQE